VSVELSVVQENLATVRAAVAEAAARSGRPQDAVELLAAVKYVEPADLAVLADAGIALVGENRVEQLLAKQAVAGERFTWDFIGHLQSRKARDLVGRVRLVHSLSTLSAAERLDRSSTEPIACLVEVNAAGEDSKQGLAPEELDAFLEAVAGLPNVRVEGLMTMPPLAASPEASRPHFAALRELATSLSERWAPQHGFSRLSMGTSQDYAVAVEEGATIVRLGSTLYRRSSV
jgi:pyridoxal phosphate enzyme (YggS family)